MCSFQSVSVFVGDCQQGAQVGDVLGGEAAAPGERLEHHRLLDAGHRHLETQDLASRQLCPHAHLHRVGGQGESQAGDGVEAAPGVLDVLEPATAGAGNEEIYGQGSVVAGGAS